MGTWPQLFTVAGKQEIKQTKTKHQCVHAYMNWFHFSVVLVTPIGFKNVVVSIQAVVVPLLGTKTFYVLKPMLFVKK